MSVGKDYKNNAVAFANHSQKQRPALRLLLGGTAIATLFSASFITTRAYSAPAPAVKANPASEATAQNLLSQKLEATNSSENLTNRPVETKRAPALSVASASTLGGRTERKETRVRPAAPDVNANEITITTNLQPLQSGIGKVIDSPTRKPVRTAAEKRVTQLKVINSLIRDRGRELMYEYTSGFWTKATVKRGDNFTTVLRRAGVKGDIWSAVSRGKGFNKRIKHIRPGQKMDVMVTKHGVMQQLVQRLDRSTLVKIKRTDDGRYESETIKEKLTKQINSTSGEITNSLFLSMRKVGVPDSLTMEFVEIFQWDIDFTTEIRRGDKFKLVFEELYRGDELVGHGRILAAEFRGKRRKVQAVRYTDPRGQSGYYQPDGRGMRKAFIRNPVSARVSSHFNPNRIHPIFKKKRPHRGVDYAAPTGTPIKAVGEGKIIHRANSRGYGKTIMIDHGRGYTTLYAHLSKYRSGVAKGSRVSQGQVIGYVGSTGWATGPHLHYEFRVNGKHVNPLTVRLPKASSLPARYKKDFLQRTKSFAEQLQQL